MSCTTFAFLPYFKNIYKTPALAETDEVKTVRQKTETEMPKDGRKGKKRHGLLSMSDLTLHDFADCPRPQSCGRVRKSIVNATVVNAIPKTASAVKVLEHEDEDLTWFEKDLDSFVIEEATEEHYDEDIRTDENLIEKDKKRQTKTASTGHTYPQDLWFLLSEYIAPEDIGTFSRICKGSHNVTLAVSFWRQLYERLVAIKGKDCLPSHLRPHSLERLHGLRARVICSLFILHPILANRVQSKGPMEDEPYALKGHRCLLAWHQPAIKGWQFCFKFQKPSLQSLTSQRQPSKLDIYHGYNDLFYNPEEGCSVLQVTCCHFASVASVMGLLLNQVYVTLSTGFRHHRLRLHFDTSVGISQNVSDSVVVLDDVLSIKLIHWWHPGYPFAS